MQIKEMDKKDDTKKRSFNEIHADQKIVDCFELARFCTNNGAANTPKTHATVS